MKKAKTIFVILLALFTLFPLLADGEWYEGKKISNIEVTGLKNVKESTVKALVQPYIGQSFTDELYSELDSSFYSSSWLDYMVVNALPVDGDDSSLLLSIEVYENPMISDVSIIGNDKIGKTTLLNAQNLTKGGWYSSNNLKANCDLIKDHYISKGYADAECSGEITKNEENNTVSIAYTVNEGKQYKIRAILFEGNNSITSKELKSLLESKEKSFFNSGNYIEANTLNDKTAIVKYYATKGYPDALVKDVRKEVVEEETTDSTIYLNLIYEIEEGNVYYINSITVEGNTVFTEEEINSLITVKSGDLYNIDKIESIYTSLATKYYDNGYVYSNVTPNIEKEGDNLVNVSFSIVEGPQTVVEEIRINGLTKTKPYVLERELAIKVGDVFSRANFIQSQQNMYNTSLLKNITANLYPGTTENGVICEFNVEEGNQMELQFGATFGANEIDGFPVSGFLSLSNSNLGGRGRNLVLSTELSPSTQSLSVSLSDGWVGDKRWSNSFSLSVNRNVRSNTLQKAPGSDYYDGRDDSEMTYPLGYNSAYEWYNSGQATPSSSYLMKYDNYAFTIGYNTGYSWVYTPGTLSVSGGLSIGLNKAYYDSNKYTPYEKLIELYQEKWQFSNKLNLSLTWDGRNYVDKTPHGYVLSSTFTYAGGILGGLSNYNKLALSANLYRGIYRFENKDTGSVKNLILGFSTEVDFMFPQFWNKNGQGWKWYDAKDGATKYEMLYIDGMNIARGFPVKIDKSFLWNNQISLTYPLAQDVISLEGFASATAVTSKLEDLSFSGLDWYMAAGFGIKMEIPGFPLGLYLVKNATVLSGESWKWTKGPLFSSGENSGVSLVLAITTSIY